MDMQASGNAEPREAAAAADDSLTGADDSFGFGGAAAWSLSGELPAGADLGGVTIVRLVAQGGMGRVYEARQEAPRRTVAVKVLREGAVSRAAAERLLREAETLALLRHPAIAQIYTAGTAPEAFGGTPFLVMELVAEARPITRFATARALSIRDRVALFRTVCDAVAHGHGHGVVHRDLKPANILVDQAGEPKVIDYGIAASGVAVNAADAEPADATHASRGDVVGTLRYMSPEQVLAPERGPDARSDVYALGLVLHELVAGRLPYDLGGSSFAEATRLLARADAPGTAVVERAAGAEMRRDDARSLAVIVAKCLEPAAADRYATAAELADDLGRWLEGGAIAARPPTPMESLRRMARRHRLAVAAATAAVVALAAGMLAVSFLSVRLDAQRRAAGVARARADAEAAEARGQLYASTVLLAAAARDRDNVAEAGALLSQARGLAEAGSQGEPVELACLAASLDDSLVAVQEHPDTITGVAWSPDGRWIATGDRDGRVRLRSGDPRVDTEPRTLVALDVPVWSVAFSPDGSLVAVAAGDGSVRVCDAATGAVQRVVETGGQTTYAAEFSPDGERLATASRDRTTRVWDLQSGREIASLRGHEGTVYGVAFSTDGETLATASHDCTVRVWDAATGRLKGTLRGHEDRVFDVAIARDGRTIGSASEDGTVRLWDAAMGVETACLRHPVRVNAIAFSPAGDRVATAAADGICRIWGVGGGTEPLPLRGHAAAAWSVAWSPDGATLASGGADGSLRTWSANGRLEEMRTASRVLSAAFSPDGATLAAGLDGAEVRLWDAATLADRGSLAPAHGRVNGVAWSPDGGLVAAACDDGEVFVWDAATRERLAAAKVHGRRVYAVAFSPDGGRVVTASEDRTVGVFDPRTGAAVGDPLPHPRRVFCAAYSPDGAWIATACEDRAVRLFDAGTGREEARLTGHEGPVNWVAFSRDGSRLASASSDGTVRIWRTADGSTEHVLAGPANQVWKVAYSPDGSRVAAAAADGGVHLWNAVTGRPALTLRGHRDQVWAVAFAADGRSIASGSWDGSVRLWGVSPATIFRRAGATAPGQAAER